MLAVEMSATIHRKSLSEMEKQKGKYKLPGRLSINQAAASAQWTAVLWVACPFPSTPLNTVITHNLVQLSPK